VLSTDRIRYSTTQDTNALVQRAGPQLCLLVADPTLVEGLAAGTTAAAIPVICSARSRCCSSGNWSPAPDDIRRTWPGPLNAFLHPAMQRFLFNAGRRLRDGPGPAVADLPAEADRAFTPSRPA
jgi:hypothetical protein